MLYLRRTHYNETFNQLLLSFLVVAAAVSNSSATLLWRNSGEPARLDPNKYNLRLKKNPAKQYVPEFDDLKRPSRESSRAAKSMGASVDGLPWRFF